MVEPQGNGDAETEQGHDCDVEGFDWDVFPDGTAGDLVRAKLVVQHGYYAHVLGRNTCVVGGETGESGQRLDGIPDWAADKFLWGVI